MGILRLTANKPVISVSKKEVLRLKVFPLKAEQLVGNIVPVNSNYTGASMEQTHMQYDQIYGSLFLQPNQTSDIYNIHFDDNYGLRRYNKVASDFIFEDDGSGWKDISHEHYKNWFLMSLDETSSKKSVVSRSNIDSKRGFFYRFAVPPTSDVKDLLIHLFFGLYYKLDVYRNGLTVLYCKIVNGSNDYKKVGQGYITGGFGNEQKEVDIGTLSGVLLSICIIPMRHRCLYIYSPSAGGGWMWENIYINNMDLSNITAKAPFGFKSEMKTTFIQMMPITYPTNGYATFVFSTLVTPPDDYTYVYMEDSDYPKPGSFYDSNVDLDFTQIEFQAPIVEKYTTACGALISLTYQFRADKKHYFTPFLYSHYLTFKGSAEDKLVEDSQDITNWTKDSLHYNLSNDAGSRSIEWETTDETIIAYLKDKQNIPILLEKLTDNAEWIELFYGLMDAPTYDIDANILHCKAQDLWKHMNNTWFGENWVADGLRHTDVIGYLLRASGIPEERYYIDTDPTGDKRTCYVPPYAQVSLLGASNIDDLLDLMNTFNIECPDYGDGCRLDMSLSGEPLVQFLAGSTISEAMKYIQESWVGGLESWFMGFVYSSAGKIIFAYLKPGYYESLPTITLYNKIDKDQAIDITKTYWIDNLNYEYIEPEATRVRVFGHTDGNSDFTTGNVIWAEMGHSVDENPLTPVTERGRDWVGEKRVYCMDRNDLITPQSVNILCMYLLNKLSKRRTLITFQSEFTTSIVPNRLVTLVGIGTVKIQSMDINFSMDNKLGYNFPTTYIGELQN